MHRISGAHSSPPLDVHLLTTHQRRFDVPASAHPCRPASRGDETLPRARSFAPRGAGIRGRKRVPSGKPARVACRASKSGIPIAGSGPGGAKERQGLSGIAETSARQSPLEEDEYCEGEENPRGAVAVAGFCPRGARGMRRPLQLGCAPSLKRRQRQPHLRREPRHRLLGARRRQPRHGKPERPGFAPLAPSGHVPQAAGARGRERHLHLHPGADDASADPEQLPRHGGDRVYPAVRPPQSAHPGGDYRLQLFPRRDIRAGVRAGRRLHAVFARRRHPGTRFPRCRGQQHHIGGPHRGLRCAEPTRSVTGRLAAPRERGPVARHRRQAARQGRDPLRAGQQDYRTEALLVLSGRIRT